MTSEQFKNAVSQSSPPKELTELQLALWYAAKGEWDSAHDFAQQHEGHKDFDRLHAYLHRLEGDEWNANYWYRRAGTIMPDVSIPEELEMLIEQWV